MARHTTKVFSKLLAAFLDPSVRLILMRGGTRSGKTWAILQLLDYIGRKSKARATGRRVISVVSETLPHLKRGAIRDFETMLRADRIWSEKKWHDTDKIYKYQNAALEFFSADSPGKVHGPARDILYINEAINVGWEVYRQLSIRTAEKVIIDWNPSFEFWADDKLMTRPDAVVIDSTYLDNDQLTASQIAEIESNREADPEWWATYGEGRVGNRTGLVVQNWEQCDGLPPIEKRKNEWLGLDFGFSGPAAIVHIVEGENGVIYEDEVLYERGKDNPELAEAIRSAGLDHLECICDSAEPKSILELQRNGIRATPAEKGEDSIRIGIKVMNRYKKRVTKRSLNIIYENRNYRKKSDPMTGEYLDEPIKKHDHSRDAARYVYLSKLSDIMSGFAVTTSTKNKRRKSNATK